MLFTLICAVGVTVLSQNAHIGGARGKALLTVPMVGTGKWDDPKRPALVREAGVPFQFQLSDDGQTAIVQVSPRNLGEMTRLDDLVKKEPRARIYRPEKDSQADVVAAMKALKKDFDGAMFTHPGPVNTKPAPAPIPQN